MDTGYLAEWPSLSLSENELAIRCALNEYLLRARELPLAHQVLAAEQLSMIDEESLHLIALFAAASSGAILEIGPYVGGSTICLALGNREKKRPLLTVELGGSYESHWKVPSSDIVADLFANLSKFGVEDDVQVIVGRAHTREVKDELVGRLNGQKVGLVVADADAYLARTLASFLPLLSPDCLLVFDDYISLGAPEKAALIKPFVDSLVRDGAVREFGVFRFGTWFGQVNGAHGLSRLRQIRFEPEVGFCHMVPVHLASRPDSPSALKASQLTVLEDGKKLSRPHSLHDDIRNLGQGRYSHWSPTGEPDAARFWSAAIYFSSSDNTNPATNGRRYSVCDGQAEKDLTECW
jgi:predicted O-methyltransferase YrrM